MLVIDSVNGDLTPFNRESSTTSAMGFDIQDHTGLLVIAYAHTHTYMMTKNKSIVHVFEKNAPLDALIGGLISDTSTHQFAAFISYLHNQYLNNIFSILWIQKQTLM